MIGYLPYIALTLIAIVATFCSELFEQRGNKKLKILCFLAILLPYLFLGIFRDTSVGTDTAEYANAYAEAKNYGFAEFVSKSKPEFLFYGVMYAFSVWLKFGEIWFYSFEFVLIGVCLFSAFHKERHSCLCLCVFLFFGFLSMSFSGIRQSISTAIATLGFSRLWSSKNGMKAKDIIIFYACAAAAIMFHESAVCILPFPLIFLIKLKKGVVLIPLIFVAVLPFYCGQLLTFFNQIYPSFYYVPSTSRFSISLAIAILIFVGFCFLVFWTPTKFLRNNISTTIQLSRKLQMAILIFYGYCFFISFNSSSMIMSRFGMFFYSGLVLIISEMASSFKKDSWRVAFSVLVVVCVAGYFLLRPTLGVVPYAFRF